MYGNDCRLKSLRVISDYKTIKEMSINFIIILRNSFRIMKKQIAADCSGLFKLKKRQKYILKYIINI